MTELSQRDVEDFAKKITGEAHIMKIGYCVTIEEYRKNERGSRSLGKTIRVHPGKDTLDCCMLDCAAILSDEGKKFKFVNVDGTKFEPKGIEGVSHFID